MKKRTLKESVADKAVVNKKIEKVLKNFSPAEQTRYLDALEAVKNAGPNGISPVDWGKAIVDLHPTNDYNLTELLKSTVKNFGFVVKRIGEKLYAWIESDDENLNVDPATADAISKQLVLGKTAVRIMKELGEFSKEEFGNAIADHTGLPLAQAVFYAEHIMNQFMGGMIEKVGQDRYKVKIEEPKTSDDHINDLKKLLRNAGLDDNTTT